MSAGYGQVVPTSAPNGLTGGISARREPDMDAATVTGAVMRVQVGNDRLRSLLAVLDKHAGQLTGGEPPRSDAREAAGPSAMPVGSLFVLRDAQVETQQLLQGLEYLVDRIGKAVG